MSLDFKWRLNDFKILEDLGTGAQSFVKLAYHEPSKQNVALKVLSKHLYEANKQVRYAYNEKDILPQCKGPFTIRYLGNFQTRNFLYLVLEYVKGAELFDYIQVSKYGLSISFYSFLLIILLFLETLHQQKILYCDLKPENIMVCEDGYIKMVDFGLTSKLNASGLKTVYAVPCRTFVPQNSQTNPMMKNPMFGHLRCLVRDGDQLLTLSRRLETGCVERSQEAQDYLFRKIHWVEM